jgi:hypothetical protein
VDAVDVVGVGDAVGSEDAEEEEEESLLSLLLVASSSQDTEMRSELGMFTLKWVYSPLISFHVGISLWF